MQQILAEDSERDNDVNEDDVEFADTADTDDTVRTVTLDYVSDNARKKKASLMSFWCSIPVKKDAEEQAGPSSTSEIIPPVNSTDEQATSTSSCSAPDTPVGTKSIRQTPAQNSLSAKIALEQKKLGIMRQQLESGLGNVTKTDISKLDEEIRHLEKALSRKKALVSASQKLRAKRKSEMTEMLHDNPKLAKRLKIRDAPGRPRMETDQVDLLQTIKTLAIFGAAADDRRRSETIRSCRMLDDLDTELNSAGFIISRSATYLRLLPKRADSIEGRHHVNSKHSSG